MKLELVHRIHHKESWYGVYLDGNLECCRSYISEIDKETALKQATDYYEWIKQGRPSVSETILSEEI